MNYNTQEYHHAISPSLLTGVIFWSGTYGPVAFAYGCVGLASTSTISCDSTSI